jgi:hypothetical protein
MFCEDMMIIGLKNVYNIPLDFGGVLIEDQNPILKNRIVQSNNNGFP